MSKQTNRIDYVSISPQKALFTICFPLILVNILLACTTTLTNTLYSTYIGQDAFSVMGYLTIITTAFGSIMGSIVSASWIKTAYYFNSSNQAAANQHLFHGFLAIIIVELCVTIPLILLTNPILELLNIPEGIYVLAKTYYIYYILSYLPSAFAALFLTIVNGTGSSKRIFWINIFVVCLNYSAAYLLLAIFHVGIYGVALLGSLGAIFQLVLYIYVFRKDGYRFPIRESFSNTNWTFVKNIVFYGLLMAAQSLLCTAGYFITTYQTNRYLPLEYVSVLNVTLPLNGIMSAASSACLAFCPPNYTAKKKNRLKKFLKLTMSCCLIYGILCFLLYLSLKTWYFSRLFDNALIVTYGEEYWLWQGIGSIFLSLVYPLRSFFDSVGLSKITLLSGIGEFVGNVFCALFLIPSYGNIGRSIAYPLGWIIAFVFLSIAYLVLKKRIFSTPLSP